MGSDCFRVRIAFSRQVCRTTTDHHHRRQPSPSSAPVPSSRSHHDNHRLRHQSIIPSTVTNIRIMLLSATVVNINIVITSVVFPVTATTISITLSITANLNATVINITPPSQDSQKDPSSSCSLSRHSPVVADTATLSPDGVIERRRGRDFYGMSAGSHQKRPTVE